MFGLSQLLKSAGALALSLKGQWLREPKKTIRRAALQLETLEDRMVPTLLGQNLFPAEYAWNQNIANAPVAANSAAIMTNIGSTISVHPDWGNSNPASTANLWGIPVNIVHGNTAPKVNFIIDSYPGESDIIPVPMPANPILEGDYQNGPNMSGPGYGTNQRGDSHLLIWDQDNNIAYELYGVARPNDPVTMSGASTGGVWHAAQQTVWYMNTNQFRSLGDTSSDAAGLSVLAGLVRPDEGLPVSQGGQGAINHAIRFTLPSGRINPQYVYPASHMVYTTQGAANVPLGARFRLKNDAATNTKINALGPQAQIIARAMQQYGLILADIGAPMYITGASAHYDPNTGQNLVWNMDDVLGLQNIKSGDFEVVDLTPRVTGLSSTTAAPGNTISVYGKNFSGAAGRLSVYFGTVAATSVTYVSDTQVNVVVPNSTGTVHVQVQSGINAVDPNGQSHNVTAPIHGYGKSAATSADWFTFSTGTTISGANSTASFATPTVVSGAGDVLTIAVKDTLGNAVGGLASSAFNFTWSGGTSTGTFSTVTQTATQGTYATTFTGNLAGSTSTLTITVGGVTFAVQPTITVNAGAVNGGTSTASFATPTVAAGGGDLLTIRVKDAAGNPITGLTNSAFSFALNGGTSAGGFSTVSATATAGTYTTIFTGTIPGSTSTLTVTVAGVTLAVQPTITVTVGGVSAAASTASFAAPVVASGGGDPLTIVVKDAFGNAIAGLASSAFSFALSGGTSTGTFSAVSATATAGTYTTNFTGVLAGTASSLTITIAGTTLTIQPTIMVTAGSVNSTTSTASFATATVAVGGADPLTIRVKDAAGNPITGLSSSAFGFVLSGGSSTGTFTSATETGTPGTYAVTFVGTTFGTTSTLTITVNGVTLAARPTVAVTGATTFADDFSAAGPNQQLSSAWTKWVGGYLVNTVDRTAMGTTNVNLATVNTVATVDTAVLAKVTLVNGQSAGLVARHTGPGDRNMYMASIIAKNNSYTASLQRNVNGNWTQLYSKNYSGVVTDGVMEFDVIGSSLRLFLNGKIVAFANDTALTGPGSVGMRTRNGAVMANFSVAPLAITNQSLPFFQGFGVAGPNDQLNSAWFNRVGNIGVSSSAAVGNGAINVATVNGIHTANVTVQADVVLSGIGQTAGLVTRYAGSGDQNMYLVRVAQTRSDSFDVALYANVGGTLRTIRTQAVSSGSGTLKMTINGNNMTVSYRGSTLFTVTDSSITAAGYVGLRLRAGATADNFDAY